MSLAFHRLVSGNSKTNLCVLSTWQGRIGENAIFLKNRDLSANSGVDFNQKLKVASDKEMKGVQLIQFASAISQEDLDVMQQAIDKGREKNRRK